MSTMWTIVLTYPERDQATLDHWEDSLTSFEASASSVPGSESRVTLHVGGSHLPSLIEACIVAAHAVTGLDPQVVEALTDEVYERRALAPTLPQLVSAPEVGDMLGVSRQRVYQLAQGDRFPAPLYKLKTGPIWDQRAVEAFSRTWTRTPGRPRLTPVKAVKKVQGPVVVGPAKKAVARKAPARVAAKVARPAAAKRVAR